MNKTHAPTTAAKKAAETKSADVAPKSTQATSTRAPNWTNALGNQPPLTFQPKLTVNQPGDEYEEEADRVAAQVMRMATPAVTQVQRCACGGIAESGGECASCKAKRLGVQRKSDAVAKTEAPSSVHQTLSASSQPIDVSTRAFMEPRFGQDFSNVRVHTDSQAAQSAADVNANAYTVGSDVVFGAGQYAPQTDTGKQLLAHELTHTMQQNASTNPSEVQRSDHYTQQERESMTKGQIKPRESDINLANEQHFQPGDIVFRLGSTGLGLITGEEVTHGGIYIGNGLIHDVVGFGDRHVRVGDFYNPSLGEAAKSEIYKVVRFRGPAHQLIVERLLGNIARRDFDMPTDPIPFNLFSSADDYRTATCLEYAHAQFLYAIRQLAIDQNISANNRQLLRSTYFVSGQTNPKPLIQPTEHRLAGNTIAGSIYGRPLYTPSAVFQENSLITAASGMASDVDPSRFKNRSESQHNQNMPPEGTGIRGIIRQMFAPTNDEVVLRTFTYKSFKDSTQFFEDVTGK